MNRVCIVGASGKLGQYLIEWSLKEGYRVNAVCRPQSVDKLQRFGDQIDIYPAWTDNQNVVAQAIEGCDAVLTVLVPWGLNDYSSGTAKAVLNSAPAHARLIFSCGWHISKDGKDQYSLAFRLLVALFAKLARLFRFADLSDQVRACSLIFNSTKPWTVVRGSNLEEGPSQGLPIWRKHTHDPALSRNLTRRTDFARFMVHAINNNELVHQAPAISAVLQE
ncbi:NAD(P)-dependent oxidoreductase [Vibrio hangzhouensis]|uniref:NmrA-like family protein n=1 Tax=Vibrio hangzhouensis TaxID=462991 RepID=A0A1H5SBQ5_9VIBR|nr:NAD(P)H-binding protein [Vibrio hangzhouensis]SEF48093.1 NmrA-like family protein [Vibrio hangzhouensis]